MIAGSKITTAVRRDPATAMATPMAPITRRLLEDCGWSPKTLADHLAAMYEATFVA